MKAQIFKIHSDFYYINPLISDGTDIGFKISNEVLECKIREVLKKQNIKIYVGDFVEYDDGYITNVLDRKNFIPRPSVANIDQIVIVSAVKEPELDFKQLNRYISFA